MPTLKTDEKMGVFYRCWEASSPAAVFLLVHGLGAHSGRWEFLADFLLRNNFSSYAIELKGFGETKDLKGHIGSFDVYFEDIRSICDIIKRKNPGVKIFLLGESMGALISFLLAAKAPNLFSGLICISPVFKSRLKFTFRDYTKIFFALLFNLEKQFKMPFDSAMCTNDVDYQMTMDADCREHRLATAKLLFETAKAGIRAKFLKDKIRIPVLFLLAGEDKLVDPETSKKIFQGLKVEDKQIIEYPRMFHALSIELGRDKVFEDILKWAQRRL